MRRLIRLSDSERGATLVLLAFSMLLLMGVAAVAVDLAAVRYDLRAAQLASDAAATAGAIHIDPVAGSDAAEGCQVAWEYLLENIEDEGPTTNPPNCANFSGSCPAMARDEPASAGPYSFVITHPVPNGHALMAGQPINTDIDGAACQRLGVSVERTRDYTFGRVLGFVGGTPAADSVARIAVRPGEGEVVPLLVLDPTACNVLTVSGGGVATAYITVGSFNDVPGIIAVDSDGSKTTNPNRCGNNIYTIDANDNNRNWIRALDVPPPDRIPSAILSYALSGAPGANPIRAYDDNDVDPNGSVIANSDPAETWWRLYPVPMPTTRRITRAALDWRYNCHTSYPDYLAIVEVDGCTTGDDPHIDNLRSDYGGSAYGSAEQPPGFQQWTSSYSCTETGPITESGDWWVDCPGGFVVQDGVVTFEGGDLVFDGGVEVKSFGELHINSSPSSDHIVYLRSGDLQKGAQSSLTMERIFVYLESGRVNLGGGAGIDSMQWIAPLDGKFEDLALWAEAPLQFEIGGQAGNTLEGTFFTPFADPFRLSGQGDQLQAAAQFLTRRLEVSGQGQVFMTPDPDRSTRLPIRGVLLIR
ncbi:MAG TPA: hypothetical protein VM848_14705 [Acidimicrobiia bacterium]|nr:hypothetical protein [Acidimicrobiia bacterium]